MGTSWLILVTSCVVLTNAVRGGSSLRGALEALQRRQRSHGPYATLPDYVFYDFIPPTIDKNALPDFIDTEDLNDSPESEDSRRENNHKYLQRKSKNEVYFPNKPTEYEEITYSNIELDEPYGEMKESPFRERSNDYHNDQLSELFSESEDRVMRKRSNDYSKYALALGKTWDKYKTHKSHNNNREQSPHGIVKLYKDKTIKKRYSDNWGPIAFKRKRSSNAVLLPDYETQNQQEVVSINPKYNAYNINDDDDDKDDMREEYAIAFQPLDGDSVIDPEDGERYVYESTEKRFPVTKRSSGLYYNTQSKRFVQNKHKNPKKFRSSSGTDPRIIKDLSQIFGEPDRFKTPVKRSSNKDEIHENTPPKLTMLHNNTHEHKNFTKDDDDSHEQHSHALHHPGMSAKHAESVADHKHNNQHETNGKPIVVKKKSIDWSDYFGIDKRKKKSSFLNDANQDKLRKQYFETYNKEVIFPLNTFRKHSNIKRNYVQIQRDEESGAQVANSRSTSRIDEKRTADDTDTKLDSIDKKLKNMEGIIVDEALHYSSEGETLDSKEEQEMKEKMLSRLAAAYSLEKMRKALKEFKQSLQTQRAEFSRPSASPDDEVDNAKSKRVAVKKEKPISDNNIPKFRKSHDKNEDFEEEQGAGHYVDGKNEEQYSDAYMGGSGRYKMPVIPTAAAAGGCPVLGKIVQRCRGVDLLAGDRGLLFLPLCSLHQICYLCGDAPPTTCDLLFLSEADTACEGDMSCQKAARTTLMALRELHDNLADELDGECAANPCLPATLKLNLDWQRAIQR